MRGVCTLPTVCAAHENQAKENITVDSRYFELGYFDFFETRSVYLDQKYVFNAFSNNNLALETFIQINLHFG